MSSNMNSTRNVTESRPVKRKRETPASRVSASSSRNNTPNAYSRRSPPREQRRSRSPSPIRDEEPRQLKRPGAGARITEAQKAAAEAARRRREEEERKMISEKTNAAELVAEHYNAVPEYGRDWRKTDSQIKGLRSLNNWIKSTLIQKFSRPDIPVQELLVLDMACGKGGDLGKWEKAPQAPALYVGCDIASESVNQARSRHEETLRKNNGRHRRKVMEAQFYVQDTFGKPLGEIPVIRQVGFNPNAGPGSGVIQPGMAAGGFDVVSMMFALHYSFESETLARGMLKNVAGALKKGGRFIGVLPNSDVISAQVKRLLQAENHGSGTENGTKEKDGGEEGEVDEDEWDPEKPAQQNGAPSDEEDEWDPELPAEPVEAKPLAAPAAPSNGAVDSSTVLAAPPFEWGNSLYTVRFPRSQPLTQPPSLPLPADGIFRPPFGWRYSYQLAEAVNDVFEYVVPWEALRALAEEYGLELLYRKPFADVLKDEAQPGSELGILAERMGVLGRRGEFMGSEEEMEAAGFYHAFCFYRT